VGESFCLKSSFAHRSEYRNSESLRLPEQPRAVLVWWMTMMMVMMMMMQHQHVGHSCPKISRACMEDVMDS
jgi:hypothetical protein